jgi:hypothetical protein
LARADGDSRTTHRYTCVNPAPDVRHDDFLVDVVEQIVSVPGVELQHLVGGTRRVVEELTKCKIL